jgi:uncharacterized protein (TIGR00255 family)
MTGFGKAETEFEYKKISVEIKSLNSKQCDVNLRMPNVYREKEMDLRTELLKKIQRGKIDVSFIVDKSKENNCTIIFNEEIFKAYFEKIKAAGNQISVDVHSPEIIHAILRLPEVFETEKKELNPDEWAVAYTCLEEALKAFDTFRAKEGLVLIDDILHRVAKIEALLVSVEPYEKERIETIKTRIDNNLNEILPAMAIDKNRFEQELIYYLEKIDITEEKVRLKQHCSYFKQTVEQEAMPGRKLGFIAQEMGREINTLGSKANEANIQQIVVKMKDELEKIKEQLLNVL